MARILSKQDFIRALPWAEDNVVVLIGDAEEDDGYAYRIDLDHNAVCELIKSLNRAMDINNAEDVDEGEDDDARSYMDEEYDTDDVEPEGADGDDA